jgi:serine/threonine protein kinase
MSMLGPFRIEDRLGRGGMGVVRAAIHEPSGLPVAVKLLPRLDDAARRRFGDEVRAAASLDHPHVVRVLDVGRTVGPLVLDDRSTLPDGTPWLVMERATHTLADRLDALDWPALQRTLCALLDALAFVHAAGLLHRDVKPANVLLGCRRDPLEPLDPDTGGLRLADFGLVWGRDADPGSATSGSPSMMAPEQQSGRWADFGPWTDLFAVGCIAGRWMGACREAPPGLADWIARLTAVEPWRRPDRAMVARDHLMALGDPVSRGPCTSPSPTTDTATRPQIGPLVGSSPSEWPDVPVTVRPLPERWTAPRSAWPTVPIAAAGWGMQRHRDPLPVGRDERRQALWSALREVVRTGRPARRVLAGVPGSGRHHLASWTARLAHAAGTTDVLRLLPDVALDRPMAALTGVAGLDPARAEARLRRRWGATWSAEAVGRRLADPTTRCPVGAWVDLAARVARRRPLVVVAREVVDDSDVARFCRHLTGADVPVLVLETRRAGADVLEPLPDGEMEGLIRSALPVESGTLVGLLEQGAGLPGRVLDALAHTAGPPVWTAAGFRWPEVPDATGRATSVAAGWAPEVREAVALAALRRGIVHQERWRRLVGELADVALETLLACALAVRVEDQAWTFVTASTRVELTSELSSSARRDGHRRWAAVDEALGASDRAGTHWIAAGERARGARLLLEAARAAQERGGQREAERILGPLIDDATPLDRPAAEALLEWLRASDHAVGVRRMRAKRLLDTSMAASWFDLEAGVRAELALLDDVSGPDAVAGLEAALARAEAADAGRIACRIRGSLAMTLLNAGRLAEAEAVASSMERASERDRAREAMVWTWVHIYAGRHDAGRVRARELIDRCADGRGAYEVSGWHALAVCERGRGDPVAAAEACRRGLAILRVFPQERDAMRLHETLAGVHWSTGRFEDCHAETTRALVLARRMGRPPLVPLVGLAMVEVQLARWTSVAAIADALDEEVGDHPVARFTVAVLRAVLAWRARDAEEAVRQLAIAREEAPASARHPVHGTVVGVLDAVRWDGPAVASVGALRR